MPPRVSIQMRPKKRPVDFACRWHGRHVKDGGRRVAEKLVADEAEGVVLAVEVVRVHQQHLDEAGLVEVQMQAAAEAA